MIGFKSVSHQGWAARKYSNATIDQCPYPQFCQTAKEWRGGWDKANKGESWALPRRRVRIEE